VKKKLAKMILAGNSRFNVDLVAAHIGSDELLFGELIELIHSGEPPIPQRAAWIMTAVTDNYPWLILPYLGHILKNINAYSHPGIIRCVLRQLSMIDFPEELSGKIFDLCYNFLNDQKQPVAIRVHAMQILYNISEKETDLKNELSLIFKDLIVAETSGGIKSRVGKLLRKLNKRY
jgi:hypothetical protein